MPLSEHPLRRELVREMHLRPFAPVMAPARLVQIVLVVDDAQRAKELERLEQAAGRLSQPLEIGSRHARLAFDNDRTFMWEQHTEATTITAMVAGKDHASLSELAEWTEDWPGVAVRATKIFVEASEADAIERLPDMDFAQEDLVVCEVRSGVIIRSDFRIREDGFGRLLVTAGKASPDETGRIIQNLQELGNYRNLALLALPDVRRLMPELTSLENRLSRYSLELGDDTERDDEELLQDLSQLSAELARIRVENNYRLNASRAYAQIVSDRLQSLSVRPRENFQSLSDFTERRLLPAMRTCDTFTDRLRRLSERSGDAIALLSTRIDTRIKAQNLELLRSMESSFSLQLRLQNLVEALSIVAASYYAVGLLAFLLKGAKAFPDGDWIDMAIAIATPLVILAMVLLVSWRRKKFIRETETGPLDSAARNID